MGGKKCWCCLLQDDVISLLQQGNVKKSKLTRIVDSEEENTLYQINNLRNFNEIFKKKKISENSKGYIKTGVALFKKINTFYC